MTRTPTAARAVLGLVLGAGALTTVPDLAHACSCGGWSPFLDVAPAADAVVIARVVQHGDGKERAGPERPPHTMMVAVERVLRGAATSGRIWVDDGGCHATVSGYPVGTRWVLALFGAPAPGKAGRSHLAACAESGVEARDGRAIGGITRAADYGVEKLPDGNVLVTNEPEELPLEELVRRIRERARTAPPAAGSARAPDSSP